MSATGAPRGSAARRPPERAALATVARVERWTSTAATAAAAVAIAAIGLVWVVSAAGDGRAQPVPAASGDSGERAAAADVAEVVSPSNPVGERGDARVVVLSQPPAEAVPAGTAVGASASSVAQGESSSSRAEGGSSGDAAVPARPDSPDGEPVGETTARPVAAQDAHGSTGSRQDDQDAAPWREWWRSAQREGLSWDEDWSHRGEWHGRDGAPAPRSRDHDRCSDRSRDHDRCWRHHGGHVRGDGRRR